jgi:two-component system, LytTR family, sensor kinase
LLRLLAALLLGMAYHGMFNYITGQPWSHAEVYTDLLYATVYFMVLYELYRVIDRWFARKFNTSQLQPRNFIFEIIIFVLTGSILLFILNLLFIPLYGGRLTGPANDLRELRMFYVLSESISLLYISVLSGLKVFGELQKMRIRKKRLELSRAQAHAQMLKNQVSPHFLFNSLNALSSLIYTNEDQAYRFIKELSNVFRYVLKHKDRELIVLRDELEFAQAFFYLVKIRFRDNIRLETHIPASYLEFMLPPLSLQMLLENAIKHNIISKDEPLTIAIRGENQHLSVSNNLQQRTIGEKSTGIGLKNIADRYKYLTDQSLHIIKTEKEFTARLPLISPA